MRKALYDKSKCLRVGDAVLQANPMVGGRIRVRGTLRSGSKHIDQI